MTIIKDRRTDTHSRRTLQTGGVSVLGVAALSLALAAAGCTSPGVFGGDKGGTGIGSGSGGSGGGGGGGTTPPPVTPPSTQTPIPANATRVAFNKKPGVPLSFTPPQSGQVYVLDATDTKLLMNVSVLQGQTLATDPPNNRVLLGGRELQRTTFDPAHFYELYFAKQ